MKKKIRKVGIVGLLGMLLLSSNFSMMQARANEYEEASTYSKDAQEETNVSAASTDAKTLLPYITGFSFVDGEGKAFSDDYKIPIDKNTKVKITYDFDFPDTLSIAKNQCFQLQLPEYFLLGEEGIPETALQSNQNIQAVWGVSQRGMITITFLEDVKKSDISGGLVIDSYVDKDKIDSETIDFGLGPVSGIISVYPTAYEPMGEIKKTVDKNAFDKNTKEITWKLNVTPKENTKNLKGFTITDTFAKQGEQGFVDGSLYDETTKQFLQPEAQDASSFTYTFPADTTDGVHALTYRTKVHEAFYLSDLDQLENTVMLSKDAKDVSSSSALIQNIKQPVLEKTAGKYDPVTKKIAYTLIINKDEREIKSAHIQDSHPLQTEIDNIVIHAMDQNGLYTIPVIPKQVTHNNKANEIVTDIDLGDIHEQMRITYDMEIKDLDSFLIDQEDYNKGYKVTNVAKLFSDQVLLKSVSITKSIAIGQGDGRASFTKQGRVIYGDPQINQDGMIIEWTVVINQNKADIAKVGIFKDELPTNLTYVSDSFTINGVKKTDAYDEKNRALIYTIDPIGKDTYTIKFQTRIDNWTFDKAQNAHIETPNTASFTVANEVQKSSHNPQLKLGIMLAKSGSFDNDAQEFTWSIQVNQKQVAMKDVIVTDVLPEGHEFVKDSIRYSGNEASHWSMVQNGLELIFSYHDGAMLCQDTTITFKSRYTKNDGVLPDTYTAKNQVALTSSNTKGVSTSAEVKVSYLPSLTKTTTYKSGNSIPWVVGINHNGAYLVKDEAVLIDFLQPGLALDVTSVALYQYKNGNTGEKIKIDVPESHISYNELTREFRFTLPKGIDLHKAYDLNFTTNITILSLDEVTNEISFDGSRQDTSSNAGRIPLMISGSSGFVKGENVTVSLTKQNEDNQPLQGAVFKLSSIAGAMDYIEDVQTSDANGNLTFHADLKYEHDYVITELQAPKGYRLMDPLVLHIDKKVSENGKKYAQVSFNGKTEKLYTDAYGFLDISEIITNEAITISVQKVDDTLDAKPVIGAKLGIYLPDDSLAKDLQGNECIWVSDGTIKQWVGIPAGDYVLKELSTPSGYFQAADINFTIDAKGNISSIDQQPHQGSLLTMVDTSTNVSIQKQTEGIALSGASLQILDEEKNVVDAWISGDEEHILRGLLKADTTYTLHEVTPPAGYASASDITFTTFQDAQLQEIVMEDASLQIQVVKLAEDTKQPLPGAMLALYDEDNNKIETWLSTEEPYLLKEKLQVNASYVIREEVVPAGYHKAADLNFTVQDTAEVQTVSLMDAPTNLSFKKVDAETKETLPGAQLAVYDKDGTLVEAWTSEKEAHAIIGKLTVGESYTLREEKAPAGYHMAEDVTFVVEKALLEQTVVMEDEKSIVAENHGIVSTGDTTSLYGLLCLCVGSLLLLIKTKRNFVQK